MKKLRNVFSFIISILLMFSLIITSLLILIDKSLLNKNIYMNIVKENNIAETVSETVLSRMQYVLLTNNIPQDIITEVITVEEVLEEKTNSMINLIDYLTGNTEKVKSFEPTIYADRVKEAINNYVNENNIVRTQELEELLVELDKYTNELIAFEVEPINFEKITEIKKVALLRNVTKIICNKNILLGALIIDLILIGILIFMWKNRKYRGLAWAGYGFLSSGIILFMIGFSGYLSKFYSNIIIAAEGLKVEVAAIIEKNLINLSIYGGILAAIGLILVSVYWKHLYIRFKKGR